MVFDFKKEYKELYVPKTTPGIFQVPQMNFIAVRGTGDPNEEKGEYQQALEMLYPIAYTLRMSEKTEYQIAEFHPYVVPPLEGFWWQEGIKGVDYANKKTFQFISLLRLPDFVRQQDVQWAIEQATIKKKRDFSKVEWLTYEEGLCVQCLHVGPYDEEPQTTAKMHEFLLQQGYQLDITDVRYHHEIYLSDPRRTASDKLRTVLRHPIKKKRL